MAGDWIKFEVATPEKPEVFAITAKMGWSDPDLTVGKLLKVWRWFDQQTIDGNAPSVTPALLDCIAGVTGFASAMVNVGWLIVSDIGLSLPNFGKHNGKTAKQRCQTAVRVANHKSNANANADGNADSVSDALPREEKRREDKEETTSSSDDDKLVCPIGSLVNLYHECMPMNPQVKVLNEARKKAIRQRWKEAAAMDCKPFGYSTKADGLEAWRQFFEVCAESDFLTGRAPAQPGKPPFVADIDFLFSPSGFAKTLENKYHREAA